MMQISFKSKEFEAKLKRVRNNLSKKNALLSDIAKEEIKDAQYRIMTSKTDPNGKSWAPWSYATMKDRNKRSLLYRTGRMYRSFSFRIHGDNSVSITNDAPYAKYHQEGTSKMPKRAFLGWNSRSIIRMKKMFIQHLGK